MKKIILILALLSSSVFAKDWQFIPFPTDLPTDYKNTISTRRDFMEYQSTLYKNNIVFAHPNDGFTIYTGKEWKFYTPKKIRELIGKSKIPDSLNLNNITIFNCTSDNNNNLWMNSYNAIFRYRDDPEKMQVYNKFKMKNGQLIIPYYINTLFKSGNNIYCRAFYYDSIDVPDDIVKGKYFLYDKDNDEFVEKYELESMLKIFDGGTPVILDDGNIYNYNTLVSYDYLEYSISNLGIIKIENDTLIKERGDYFIKFFKGNQVGVDSTMKYYLNRTYNKKEYYRYYIPFYQNRVLYIYCYSNARYSSNGYLSASNIIVTQNFDTGKIDTISVPFVFKYDNKDYFAKEFLMDSTGKMALIYPGAGIYLYDPNSSVTEGDEDLMFVVGVNVHKMYPNPTSDRCHIDFFLNRLHINNIKVQISDINGKIYKDISKDISYNSSTQDASLDFSVADIPQGNYYVLFTSANNKQMRGLLILK